jgi:serine/threonine protein phosphatase PrpC
MRAALAVRSQGATHVGRVRKRNEDSFITLPHIGVAAVSDGMGGHEAGDVPSAAVVRALGRIGPQPSAVALLQSCEAALNDANREIRDIAASRRLATIGATVVALLNFERHYACLWAGDSRAYLVRRGEIAQITRDHTEVAQLVANGVLTPQEAKLWPRRNVITRAVGAADALQLELASGEIEPGDIFVLCSDGLTGHVEAEEIAATARRGAPETACAALIDLALERGGSDNVTVVVMQHNAIDEERTILHPKPPPSGGHARAR